MTATVSELAVRVSALDHHFGVGEARNQVLFNNNLEIEAGQLVVMTGPSGSGKTTLLTLIGALRSVQQGSAEILGHDLAGMSARELVAVRRDIGFIFQAHNLFESLTAYENVKMAMQLSDCPASRMRERGVEVLTRLGLEHRVDFKPRALSGGQRQRVACARALVNQPRLILADEPTAALDKEASCNVVALFKEMVEQHGTTIMMVTHDNRILEFADRIINMVDGRIISDVTLRDAIAISSFLRESQVFSSLTPEQIANVAERMKKRRFAAGDVVIRRGDVGDEFHIIGKGAVGVFTQPSPEPRVATLAVGDFFGERALISGEPRSATVVADEALETFVLVKADFDDALALSASFKDQMLAAYFRRQ